MRIIGIDPGSEVSGIAVLDGKKVSHASNTPNSSVLAVLQPLCEVPDAIVVIEDLATYAGRIAPQTIVTAKWIGELSYRVRTELFLEPVLVPRNSVKKWIFDTCPEICIPRIKKKIQAAHDRAIKKGEKGFKKQNGEMRLPSFHYVGDREVIASLKAMLNIKTPKPGQKNEFGLAEHSWSALAIAEFSRHNLIHAIPQNGANNIPHKAVRK